VVRIRLQRLGRRNRPFYRISVMDERVKRDGRLIEELGWYDPVSKDEGKQLNLNEERAKYWISKGAQPSETLMDIFAKRNLVNAEAWNKRRAWRIKAKQSAAAAAPAAKAE
jgi:small subunit ribosomal protein S16